MNKDFVFVDTSVFCKANYFVKNGAISQFFQLHDKGRIVLLMPAITKQEIQRNYKKDLAENFEKLGKLHKLKNIDAYSLPVMTENEIAQEVESKISEMTKHVYELDYSYCQDVVSVFKRYFEKQYPFACKGKEKEFPDAFALQAIEKYATDNNINKVIVLSQDGDMKEYKSAVLDISVDYKTYLSRKLKEDTDLSEFKQALENTLAHIEEELKQKVEILLSNPGTYQEVVDFSEVTDVSINGFEVKLNLHNCYITSIGEHTIEADLHARVEYSVHVEYLDSDTSYYDREYDHWLFRNYASFCIDRSDNITVSLSYSTDKPSLKVRDYGIDNLEDAINGREY